MTERLKEYIAARLDEHSEVGKDADTLLAELRSRPAAPARADEPRYCRKCKVSERDPLQTIHCSVDHVGHDFQHAFTPTERPGAEPKRCKPSDHVFLNEFGQDHTPPSGTRCECGDVAYFSGSSDIPPSSPERERAQERDTPWSVRPYGRGLSEVFDAKGVMRCGLLQHADAERIKAAVNAEAELRGKVDALQASLNGTCDERDELRARLQEAERLMRNHSNECLSCRQMIGACNHCRTFTNFLAEARR